MRHYLVHLLTLTLLALVSCSPSAPLTPPPSVSATAISPAQTVAPAALALPTLDTSSLLGSPSTPWDASRVNDAAGTLKTQIRETSGLRAQLGPQADELFRLVDEVETAAVQDLIRQVRVNSKPQGLPAPLPPRTGSTRGAHQALALASVFTVLIMAPDLVPRPDYARGMRDQPRTTKETDQTLGDNVRSHATLQTQVTGSRAEIDVQITIRAEKDGRVYEEQAHAKISMSICPDEGGKVPVDLSMQISATSAGSFQTEYAGRAVGLVDDEANLIGVDMDGQTGTSIQGGTGALTGGETNSFIKGVVGGTMRGMNSPNAKDRATTDRSKWTSGSPGVTVEFAKLANLGPSIAVAVEFVVLQQAEKKWKDSYCITVRVDNDLQTVLAGSETQFTARLQHPWEGRELNFPIIATLQSGAVSIAPSGVKVPAAATFRYKAPDASGQEATVELISSSRRGIGKLNVIFKTQKPYYYAMAEFGLSNKVSAFGEICAMDKPFTLNVYGHNPSGGEYVGNIAFTPTSMTAGSWKHTATSYIASIGKAGKESGNSTYQVEGLQGDKPLILMNATTESSEVDGYVGTWPWPAWQIELTPKTGVCSPN